MHRRKKSASHQKSHRMAQYRVYSTTTCRTTMLLVQVLYTSRSPITPSGAEQCNELHRQDDTFKTCSNQLKLSYDKKHFSTLSSLSVTSCLEISLIKHSLLSYQYVLKTLKGVLCGCLKCLPNFRCYKRALPLLPAQADMDRTLHQQQIGPLQPLAGFRA